MYKFLFAVVEPRSV